MWRKRIAIWKRGVPPARRSCCRKFMRVSSRTLLATFALLLSAAIHAQDALPSAEELEVQGAVIGSIAVIIKDVFDTSLPEEDNGVFRLANRLHINTRESVIRRQLLFKTGVPFSQRLLLESERILRGNRYLFDAEIVPVRYVDGVVDIEVRTQDVWTFKPGILFTRSGGSNTSGFDLQESNLFGYGKEVTIRRRSDVDRDSMEYRYSDPHVLGSWNRFVGGYSNNSDGRSRYITLERPFYSFDTKWGAGANALDGLRTEQRYNLGYAVDEFKHEQQRAEATAGWSTGWVDGWVLRLHAGGAHEDDRFTPTDSLITANVLPPDRKLVYPYVGLSVIEDDYEERRNQNQIERTEDFYAGTTFAARLGRASGSFGADRSAWLWGASGRTSLESSGRVHTLTLSAAVSGREETEGLRNFLATGDSAYYWRINKHHLLFASVRGATSSRLDPERQMMLGGDNGLRGYPLRYQGGETQALFTLEHRMFSDLYLLRLFHVGGAVFFDMGRMWGNNDIPGIELPESNLGMLKDVGFGLRLGSSRSAFGNVIHIDLAFPLDGDNSIDNVQFLVETKRSF
jgi:outer membrane protein assembly factor BamA